MDIFFIRTSLESDEFISYIINDNDQDIGDIRGSVNYYGTFILDVRVAPDFQNSGIGFEAFSKVFDELELKQPIVKWRAAWNVDEQYSYLPGSRSTNLTLFQECIEAGGSVEECAFITPTGKWALKKGFRRCNLVLHSPSEVVIDFLRVEQ